MHYVHLDEKQKIPENNRSRINFRLKPQEINNYIKILRNRKYTKDEIMFELTILSEQVFLYHSVNQKLSTHPTALDTIISLINENSYDIIFHALNLLDTLFQLPQPHINFNHYERIIINNYSKIKKHLIIKNIGFFPDQTKIKNTKEINKMYTSQINTLNSSLHNQAPYYPQRFLDHW